MPTSPFASEVLCAASICSATRLFVCLVLSRIGSPFQVNLYHQTRPRLKTAIATRPPFLRAMTLVAWFEPRSQPQSSAELPPWIHCASSVKTLRSRWRAIYSGLAHEHGTDLPSIRTAPSPGVLEWQMGP